MADAAETDLRKAGGWVIVWGVLLIVAGIVAIVEPAMAAVATALLLAWLFVFAGVVELVYAYQQRAHDGLAWKVISGLSLLALGAYMLAFPIASIATLALLIAWFLAASGVSSVLLAFRLRPRPGWGWVLFDGVAVDRDRHHDCRGLAAEFDRFCRHPGGLLPHFRGHLANHARPRAAFRQASALRPRPPRCGSFGAATPGCCAPSGARIQPCARAASPCARKPSSDVLIVSACGSILT